MLNTKTAGISAEAQRCLRDCLDCYEVCIRTEEHCLEMGGRHVQPEHLRLLRDCAAICRVSADFLLRGSAQAAALCRVGSDICRSCAEDCGHFSGDSEMKRCAEQCLRCADSCDRAGAAIKRAASAVK